MSAYRHRRTSDPRSRLAESDRIELRMERLSGEVTAACLAWLTARGLYTPTPPAASAPRPDVEATEAMSEDEPCRGQVKSLALLDPAPCPASNFYRSQKTIFGQRPITLSPNTKTHENDNETNNTTIPHNPAGPRLAASIRPGSLERPGTHPDARGAVASASDRVFRRILHRGRCRARCRGRHSP